MLSLTNLLIRTISAIVFGLIMIGLPLLGCIPFIILFNIIIILALIEYCKLIKIIRVNANLFLLIITGLLLFNSYFLIKIDLLKKEILFILLVPLLFFIFIEEIYKASKKPIHNIAFSILAIVYIVLPLSLLNEFVFFKTSYFYNEDFKNVENINFSDILLFVPNGSITYNPSILFAFYSIIWIYDTFAYLIGVSFGKHRLFERISPKKSWEGAIGGFIVTIAISYFYSNFFGFFPRTTWVIWAAIIMFFATYGDLTESMFKRFLNVKDSSKLIPGHGGILDRFDSIFFAAPFAYLYLEIFFM
ncbi:MAG: phosphatidate cytidylyltransferase [Bacteroidales bacterium]|nr:phosphatidate cytidylyltransferase [Bacteroidales bacterium]